MHGPARTGQDVLPAGRRRAGPRRGGEGGKSLERRQREAAPGRRKAPAAESPGLRHPRMTLPRTRLGPLPAAGILGFLT